ncbi:hypothetical protein E2I21_10255 [Alcaligenaceae bacterium SAGV5]|nr:hypothetical protein [Alcaligenaceae bacterium SAGV5]
MARDVAGRHRLHQRRPAAIPAPRRRRAGAAGQPRAGDWAGQVGGWEKLVNRSSTTWRNLPEDRKQPGSEAQWLALVAEHPALVKRPVLLTADGVASVGFSEAGWTQRLGR